VNGYISFQVKSGWRRRIASQKPKGKQNEWEAFASMRSGLAMAAYDDEFHTKIQSLGPRTGVE
jgi:hypothetical protein